MESGSLAAAERFYARTFALVVLFVVGFLVYLTLLPLLAPLAWALLVTVLVYPLHARLTALLRGRYNVSAGLLTLAVGVLVLGPVTALAAAFASQIDEILPMIEQMAERGAAEAGAEGGRLQAILNRIQISFGVTPGQVRQWMGEGAKTGLEALGTLGGRLFIGAIGTAVGFAVMMFVLFFLLRDGAAMLSTMQDLIPLAEGEKARLNDHVEAVIQALIYGIGLTAAIQGAMLGAGFAVVGLPAPVVFGVIGALVALVPLVGTPLVWVPAAMVLATQGRWVAALVLVAWGLVVSTIDNFLRPMLVSKRARIGTLTVFIGVIGGVSAFGTVGLFIGPLVLSLCLALTRFLIEMRRRTEPR